MVRGPGPTTRTLGPRPCACLSQRACVDPSSGSGIMTSRMKDELREGGGWGDACASGTIGGRTH
eukprot:2292300-Pyramimonas_sp.AAC.1